MHPRSKQIAFHDFEEGFIGSRIFKDNRWVKLAKIMPWDLIDSYYNEGLGGSQIGQPAISSRMAFAALFIQREKNLSQEETMAEIVENPHCQFFMGLPEFTNQAPFHASNLSRLQKRFSSEALAAINEAIIQAAKEDEDDEPPSSPSAGAGIEGSSSSDETENQGTLILDATCIPADIHYPTDVRLLHKAREQSEQLIDAMYPQTKLEKKPRTYRKNARQNFLRFARAKRPGRKAIRTAIRLQLQYLRRNLQYISEMSSQCTLSEKHTHLLTTIQTIYTQQLEMFELRKHSCEGRIVSVSQPWVRPIVRGKAGQATEFGAKVAASVEDGYVRCDHFSFDAFNEATSFQASIHAYHERNGCYPERVLVDKIYRNRDNLAFCKAHKIKMSGPALGRPPKDKTLYREQKLAERSEAGERNAIEGKFGEAKTRYGLDRMSARLEESSECSVHMTFIVMNMKKRLRDLFVSFFTNAIQHLFSLWARKKVLVYTEFSGVYC